MPNKDPQVLKYPRKPPLVLLLGRTGSGKDTIASYLPLTQLKSYTTRPRRPNETDTHIFTTEEFYEAHKSDIIAETTINNYHYFCTKDQLTSSDLYIIDPNGQYQLQQKYLNTISIYISVSPYLRAERALKLRHDDPDTFSSRNASEDAQFTDYEQTHSYDYIVENNNLDRALAQIKAILKYEGVITNES